MEPHAMASRTYPGVDRIKGYRNPAPGSRPAPVIPRFESSDQVFDTKYYTRDTRRAERTTYVITAKKYLDAEQLKLLAESGDEEVAPTERGSDARFGNPAVLSYDPTGLRSAMTATHEELDKALEAAMPDHLVQPEWAKKDEVMDEIMAKYKSDGTFPVPGRPFPWKIPACAKVASW